MESEDENVAAIKGSAMVYCTECGFANEQGNAFCSQCGSPLEQPEANPAALAALKARFQALADAGLWITRRNSIAAMLGAEE